MRINMGREGRASSSLSANGGTMLGALILANGPTQPLEAATKYYVDTTFANLNANNVIDGILPISSLPAFTGDAVSNQGSNVLNLSNIGATPGSYAKVIVDAKGRVTGNDILLNSDIPNFNWNKIQNEPNTLSGYGITDALNVTGGTLDGQLTVGTPLHSLSIVNKQYVDSALGDNSTVVGDLIRKPYTSTPAGFLRCNGGIVDKTTYADLYAVIGDNFNVQTVPGAGQPWQQQYDINTTQSGNISSWVQNTNTPYAVLYHKCVITKHRIYLIGGGNSGSRFSTVYTAPIQSDGTIGVWAAAPSLPGEFAYFEAFVTKNYLYLIGGGTNTVGYLNTIYMAAINSDGTLGTWTTSANFPIAINGIKVAVIKNRVYTFGGNNGTNIIDSIYSAPINTDGTLGIWSLYGQLPVALVAGQIAVIKNRIYLIGGGTTTSSFVNTIYSTTIDTNGDLGSWNLVGNIPLNLTIGCIFTTKNCIYLLGGAHVLNTYTANTYRANINLDGTISNWELMGTMPYSLGYSTCVVVKNKLHILGGYVGGSVSNAIMTATISSNIQDYSTYYELSNTVNYMMPGSGKPWQQQYQINETQSANITGWATSTALPVVISSCSVIITKNNVYLIGGSNSSSIYTAPINADGTLGTWTLYGNLPNLLSSTQAIVTKNRVYLLGGYQTASVSTVYTAIINSDGTLGTWSTGTSLPISIYDSSCVITKNRVYLLGGWNSSAINTVYTAPINADGTLGAWVSTTPLPGNLFAHQAFITKNRIYLCGGHNGGGYVSTVYTASINSDGLIGTWSLGTSLPGALAYSSLIVTKNRVYLMGGHNGSTVVSTVYTAPINEDGTLGSWTTGTSLNNSVYALCSFITKNTIYVVGGNGSSAVSKATIDEGINDYSAYYDGSISGLDPIDQSPFFALPDFSSKEKNGINIYIKY